MATTTRSAINLPFDDAISYFRQKTNVSTEHWTDVMNEAHSHAFAVAGAASEALVSDFRQAVDKAIAKGTGFKEFQKDFDAIVQKHGWTHTGNAGWRARMIYETNMTTAFSAGRYAQLVSTTDVFPYWQYNHTPCANPRLQHLAWDGMVLRADDPFWSTCYPPNGWGCRCFVTAVSSFGMKAMGRDGPDQSPKLEWREWKNPRTGEILQVPKGVDPGFVYNPGQAWKDVRDVEGEKPKLALPNQVAVSMPVLKAFFEAPKGAVQIGTVRNQVAEIIGAKTPRVILSAGSIDKQARRHPELSAELYNDLSRHLAAPDVIIPGNKARAFRVIARVGGKIVSAILKVTAHGEIFVVSVHYVDAKGTKAMLRNAPVLFGDKLALLAWLETVR